MPRAAITIACASLTALAGGCCSPAEFASEHWPSGTSLMVVNHTDRPITVTYEQSPANAESVAMHVTQEVRPEYSIRIGGRRGDRLSIAAGAAPPMVVEYSRRSHVVSVTGSGADVSYDLTRGFTEPSGR